MNAPRAKKVRMTKGQASIIPKGSYTPLEQPDISEVTMSTTAIVRLPQRKDPEHFRFKLLIVSLIEDKILEVADMAEEVTRSDLQAVAGAVASEIFKSAGNDIYNWTLHHVTQDDGNSTIKLGEAK
jgi:hypothetical protein